MKLGLFTPVFGKLNQDDMLAKVRALGRIQAIELGTGGWPGHDHLDVDALVNDERGTDRLKGKLTDAGLTISALSCHGNPLHPDKKTAQAYDDTFRKTVCLAKRLDVPRGREGRGARSAERRGERRARHEDVSTHGGAIVAVPQRRLGPRRARVEAYRQRAAAGRLRLRDEHRARGRAGVDRRRIERGDRSPLAGDTDGTAC